MSNYVDMFFNNTIIIFVCFFVIAYIIINYDYVKRCQFPCYFVKSFLMSGIIFIMVYLIMTIFQTSETSTDILKQPSTKYKISNKFEKNDVNYVDNVDNGIFVPHNLHVVLLHSISGKTLP